MSLPIPHKPAILYSFRRCPYAIRARMALSYSQLSVEVREVKLSDKPVELIHLSSKATVPVLVCGDEKVIDESLDIMLWSLSLSDPDCWLYKNNERLNYTQNELIQANDRHFKPLLDYYKYAERYPEHSQQTYRERALPFLNDLEQRLDNHSYLLDDGIRLVDIALFPFIRQFAYVDMDWFDQSPLINLRNWLKTFLNHDLFKRVMKKQTVWKPADKPIYLPIS